MNKPARVSLTFDDGLRCQFERALPILNQCGFPSTFFLIANTDPILTDGHDHPSWSKIDWNQNDIQLLKRIVQMGHEVGAHSVNHKKPQLDDDPKLEVEVSKRLIEDWLGVDVLSYCYPFCHITEPIKNAVITAGYKQARGGADATYYASQGSVDWFNVDCRLIEENGAENVDGWLQPDCWHVLMFHGIGTSDDGWLPIPVTEFTRQMAELAKHRDSGAVEVVTFKAGAERLRQLK